jgi:hypothetical protein
MSAFLDEHPRLESPGRTQRVLELLESRRVLVLTYIGLHLVFLAALVPSMFLGSPLGDLPLYRQWAIGGFEVGQWPVLSYGWVYPAGALVPVVAAELAGPALYQLLWFAMTAALNGVSAYFLVKATPAGRRRYVGAWWWLLFLLLLSPVALLRLEGLVAPMVIIALAMLARRPFVASVILAAATWIKVWPIAIFLAIAATGRRWRTVLLGGITVTVGVVGAVLALGGIPYIASFITMQSDRSLQVEAPISTVWVWMADLNIGNAFVWQDQVINTEEVTGPGAGIAAIIMDPVMLLAVAAILTLIVVARRRGIAATQLIVSGSMALVTALVVFNKVGSPQYMLWIAPIVAVGVCSDWRAWRTPAILTLVIAFVTSLVFPVFYAPLLDGNMAAAALLTTRNALLIVLLGWSVRALLRLVRSDVRGVSMQSP